VSTSRFQHADASLRGFLVIFELIQLIKLAMMSIRRFMFSHTPRDIRDMTKPGYFEYGIVIVNLLFVATVGLIYAPLAPLVAMGACIVFWFSSVVASRDRSVCDAANGSTSTSCSTSTSLEPSLAVGCGTSTAIDSWLPVS